MYSSQESKKALRNITWVEGKLVPIAEGPYRHREVVCCSAAGKQKAIFANGEFSYFAYIEIINSNEERISRGINIVPVQPNGRILMIVERRPIHALFDDGKTVWFSDGSKFELGKFGTLEFPGGGVEPGESITIGGARELYEETGIENQNALVYRRLHPIYAFGSDLAIQQFYCVAYLSSLAIEKYTETDGGLIVLALSESEVEENIKNGVITSGQAALLGWFFYQEVVRARNDRNFLEQLIRSGYLGVEEVLIKR